MGAGGGGGGVTTLAGLLKGPGYMSMVRKEEEPPEPELAPKAKEETDTLFLGRTMGYGVLGYAPKRGMRLTGA